MTGWEVESLCIYPNIIRALHIADLHSRLTLKTL